MPVTHDEKSKDLPGYMQVYRYELTKNSPWKVASITDTADKSLKTFMIRYTPENTIIIKPTALLLQTAWLIFVCMVTVLVTALLFFPHGDYLAALMPLGFVVVMLFLGLQPFKDKTALSPVQIDTSGILLKWEKYEWSQLAATYIVSRIVPHNERGNRFFLVLVLKDGSSVYLPLIYFWNNSAKFATAITHFKPVTAPPSPL